MNLYRVTNGYYGDSEVAVLVIAESESAAIERARPSFEWYQRRTEANPSFSQFLEVDLVFEDTSKPNCSMMIECSEINRMENEE
jgi:hypothetical protein